MVNDIEFQELIYNLVNGYVSLTKEQIPEKEFVTDEFSEGSFCSRAYDNVLAAYERLCQRLHCGPENEDVEIIINEMNAIMKHVSLKMFRYGVFLQVNPNNKKVRMAEIQPSAAR